MLPRDWKLAIIDVNYCFFNIPPPSPTHSKVCLLSLFPQKTSPLKTLSLACLTKRHEKFPNYMPVVRCPHCITSQESVPQSNHPPLHGRYPYLCTRPDLLRCNPKKTIQAVESAGFKISKNKIQFTSPWTYLGLRIREPTVVPRQLAIRGDLRTLFSSSSVGPSAGYVHYWG